MGTLPRKYEQSLRDTELRYHAQSLEACMPRAQQRQDGGEGTPGTRPQFSIWFYHSLLEKSTFCITGPHILSLYKKRVES